MSKLIGIQRDNITDIKTIIKSGGRGPQGLSAYEVWLQDGNQGTVEDFFESLKGEVSRKEFEEIKQDIEQTMTGAINEVDTTIAKAEDKITDVENRFQTLTTEQQQDAEVIDARQGKTSLVANIQEIKDNLRSHEADYATDLNSRLKGVYKVGGRHFNILNTPDKKIRTNVFKIVTDINSGLFLLKVTGQENTGKPIMFLIRLHSSLSLCKYSSINNETPEIKISQENGNVVLWFNHIGNYIQYTFDLLYTPANYVNNVDWKVYEVDVSKIPADAEVIPLYE